MTRKKYLYILIIIIVAVLVVGFALVSQFLNINKIKSTGDNELEENIIEEKNTVEDFVNIFENKIIYNQSIDLNIEKKDNDKDLVYTIYQRQDRENGKYEFNLNIPAININSKISDDILKEIQDVFANKANNIMTDSTKFTIYNIDYIAYVNDNILSLVIKSTLKEQDSAQRIIVKTYNIDLETLEIIEFKDLINKKNHNTDEINSKILEKVKQANNEAEALSALGYDVYLRNLQDDIYKVENIKNYFIGNNGKIFIVFAYGNTNFTSEVDIVEI